MKKADSDHHREMGAEGHPYTQCARRLAGADIARTEQLREGRIPLKTHSVKILIMV